MNRLTSRERFLILLVAGTVFVLLNWMILGLLMQRHARLAADLATKRGALASMQNVLNGEREAATLRDWIAANQPRLENPEQAGVALLEEIKAAAQAVELSLENPELGSLEERPSCQAISVQFVVKGSWAALVQFLHAMQAPERFIVIENAVLQADPADAKRMAAQLKIAKWYAR